MRPPIDVADAHGPAENLHRIVVVAERRLGFTEQVQGPNEVGADRAVEFPDGADRSLQIEPGGLQQPFLLLHVGEIRQGIGRVDVLPAIDPDRKFHDLLGQDRLPVIVERLPESFHVAGDRAGRRVGPGGEGGTGEQ